MAKLNLTAVGDPINASNLGNGFAAIAVSVTNSSGVAVTGLTSSNFVLGTQLYPAGGGPIPIALFYAGPLSGTYTLYIQPLTNSWRRGKYTFALRVYNVADFETILVELNVP